MLNRKTALRLAATTSALAMASTAYAASSGDVTLNMTGTMEQVCVLAVTTSGAAASGVTLASGSPSVTSSGGVGTVQDTATIEFDFDVSNTTIPTDGTIGQIDAGSLTMGLDVYCNDDFTTNLASTNGGLLNSSPATGGDALFSSEVEYTVDYDFGNNSTTGQTSDSIQGGSDIDTAAVPTSDDSGSISVNWSGGDNLLAGDYTDTLVLTVTAN